MEIKFDVYFKKNLGTLCKDNEVDLDGKEAYINLDLSLVDRLEANYSVGVAKYTDEVTIKDIDNKEILIPFKSDVVKKGLNEFEIVAYMKNGDIKTSQTYTYEVEGAIGEGKSVSDSNHIHTNLTILNTITQNKIDEWDNKSNINHTHNIYDIEGLGNIEDYATKNYVDNEITKIELKEGPQGPKGDKGDRGEQGVGIRNITEYYQVSTSNTIPPSSWLTTAPALTSENKYLWNYRRIDYTDGNAVASDMRVIGVYGDSGVTPNISIGNVTTLEPNQQATVTKRGTDTNPIFDFGIPKGEKGEPGGIFADGGSSDCNNGKPIVEYIHQGNKEIYFTSINWDTGEAITREPHDLTDKTEIIIVPNDWSPQSYTANLLAIPQEYLRNKNRITVVPNGTNGLFIRQNDGTSTIPVSATDTGNLHIDCTKFHFEIPIPWVIDNIPGDLTHYTIVSVGYVKSGGLYRYTKHWYKDENGTVKEPSYINILNHPTIPNSACTHGVYAHQIWEIHIENGSMVLYSKGAFLGRRNGHNSVVLDRVMENSYLVLEFGFNPQGLVKLATYSESYAYMANGTVIRIYGLRW